MIGDATRPWVGVTDRAEPESADGAREAGHLVASGVDVVRVEVPASRELADRLHDAGFDDAALACRAGRAIGRPRSGPVGQPARPGRGPPGDRRGSRRAPGLCPPGHRRPAPGRARAGGRGRVRAGRHRRRRSGRRGRRRQRRPGPRARRPCLRPSPDRPLGLGSRPRRRPARRRARPGRGAPSGPATLAGRALALQSCWVQRWPAGMGSRPAGSSSGRFRRG